MFGMFAPKPDATLQKEYSKRAEQIANVCFYISQNNACPPVDGMKPKKLDNDQDRRNLVEAIEAISAHASSQCYNSPSEFISEFIRTRHEKRGEEFYQVDDAILIISTISMANLIYRDFYEHYSHYRPLQKMCDYLIKVMGPAMKNIFGNQTPHNVSKAFPYLEKALLQYRTKANFQ